MRVLSVEQMLYQPIGESSKAPGYECSIVRRVARMGLTDGAIAVFMGDFERAAKGEFICVFFDTVTTREWIARGTHKLIGIYRAGDKRRARSELLDYARDIR